jgi:hypothetical protein
MVLFSSVLVDDDDGDDDGDDDARVQASLPDLAS